VLFEIKLSEVSDADTVGQGELPPADDVVPLQNKRVHFATFVAPAGL
jgi:hypothetical protein